MIRQMVCVSAVVATAIACGGGAGHDAPDAGGQSGPDARGQGSPDAGVQGWSQIDIGDSDVEALRFTDDQHAFLAVSFGSRQGLHVTTDGAATWQPRELDVGPFGVGFPASLSTILVAGNGSKPVWVSTDRGALFMPVTWNQPGFPASVRFFDENTVLMGDAVGDRVFRSSDAGQTWTIHLFTREVLPGTHSIEVQGNNAWVVGGPAYTPDGTGATIAYSSDAALTWTITTLKDNAHLFRGGSLHGIAVVSPAEIWVAGENRQIYHTTDGMQTWTQIKGIPSEFIHFGGIAVRGNTIVAAGSVFLGGTGGYGIYRSTDGGNTFQLFDERYSPYVPDGLGVHGVEQNTKGDLFVFGYSGLFWKYAGLMLGKG
ncbi:MAG TPA: hypothetical protein VF469_28780 [Kofleriaceae bacterium]